MRMRGVIVVVGRIQSVILADDETMHSFSTSDWLSDETSLEVGAPVSFEIQDSNAVDVRPIADTASAPDDAVPDVVSQGTIRRVARADRPGMIEGDDGAEYTYTLTEWQVDSVNPIAGMRVDFAPRGSSAASVRLPGAPARTSGSTDAGSPRAPELPPDPSDDSEETDASVPALIETVADADGDAVSAINLQGTIRRVARADRLGVIQGDDGFQYTYTSDDWEPDSLNPIAGMRVSFVPSGSLATSVRLSDKLPRTSGATDAGSPRAPRLVPRASTRTAGTVASASDQSATSPDTGLVATSEIEEYGIIRRVAETDRPGMIQGNDGVQYTYISSDLGNGLFDPSEGMRVAFTIRGAFARNVRYYHTDQQSTTRIIPPVRSKFWRWTRTLVIASTVLVLVIAIAIGAEIAIAHLRQTENPLTAYHAIYPEQIAAGRSPTYAVAYTSQILNGESANDAQIYARQIDDGKSPTYANAYTSQILNGESERHAHAYAEQLSAGHLHWYAYTYAEMIDRRKSSKYAHAYAEFIESVFSISNKYQDVSSSKEVFSPGPYARAYARLVDDGKSPTYARAYADAIYIYFLGSGRATEIAEEIDSARSIRSLPPIPDLSPIDTAVVLAMYSTTDDAEAERRATSIREMTTHLGRGDMDNETALGLLAEIVPGASIDERAMAASRLANISENGDGELTSEQSLQAANELARLITGHGIDAEQRAEAAREMVRLSQSGELNADTAAELMDTIAPEWSIEERKEALGYLAWQFSEGEWDADSAQRTAEEGYTLITGGEIQIESRVEASVELVGEGLKRYGSDNYDDEGVDRAVALTQGAIRGDLTMDSVSNILGIDVGDQNTDVDEKSTRYSESYATQIAHGESEIYAKAYARQINAGKSSKYARDYARERDRGNSKAYAHAAARVKQAYRAMDVGSYFSYLPYGVFIEEGKSWKYAFIASIAEEYYDEYYRLNSNESMRRARIYMSQLDAGKSAGYADAYAEQSDTGKSEKYAHAYAEQIGAGKSENYAHDYARLITTGRPERFSVQSRASVSVRAPAPSGVSEQISVGESESFANAYAGQNINRSETYAYDYAEQIDAGKPEKYAHAYAHAYDYFFRSRLWGENFAHIYAEQFSAGRSQAYAEAYAAQIVAGKSATYASAYANQFNAVKSRLLAHGYAWLVDLAS